MNNIITKLNPACGYLLKKRIEDGVVVGDVDADGIERVKGVVVVLFLVVEHVTLDHEVIVLLASQLVKDVQQVETWDTLQIES